MEKTRRGKKLAFIFGAIFLVIFFLLISFLTDKALSYDTSVAHPNIARLAAELYNQQFDPDLSAKDIELLENGAEDEDTPFRWYNHFYDPINNEGLWFGKRFFSAKDWANTSKIQNDYALGDQSWSRALYDYSEGDRKGALVALGHVIHLMSDMTVPAHTRADIHPSGDSYEQFVKTNWNNIYLQIKDKVKYKEVLNLDSAFDLLSTFSNGYFYSDDTIESEKYNIYVISKIETLKQSNSEFSFFKDERNNIIYYSKGGTSWNDIKQSSSLGHPLVLTSYSTQLIPKSIGYSAGVIKLFFSEATKGNKGKDVALFQTTPAGYGNTLLGAIGNGVQSLWSNIKSEASPSAARSEDVSNLSTGQNIVGESQNIVAPVVVVPPAVATLPPIVVKKVAVVPPPVPVVNQPVTSDAVLVQPVVEPVVQNTVTPQPVISPVFQPTPVYYGGGGGGSSSDGSSNNNQTSNTENQTVVVVNIPTTTIETVTTTVVTTTEENIVPTSTTEIVTTTPVVSSTPVIDVPTSTVTSTVDIPTTTPDVVTSTPDVPTSTVDVPTSTIETPTTTPTTSPHASFSQEVVINEIAWAGTSADYPYDEWFELYNNTDQDITLFGSNQASSWKVYVGERLVDLQKNLANAVIPAHGYYLFERNYDETVREVEADYVYSLVYGFNNSGAKIKLVKPNGDVSDEVDCSDGWFAGDNIKYRTMERISPTVLGSDPTNWQTNQGPRFLPRNYNGGQVLGSPKTANVGGGLISLNYGQIDDEVVLTKENSPYILGYYNIPAGKKLTIEPGVIVKSYYNGSRFDIYGTLQVNGTDSEPVFFTSGRDLSQDNNFVGQLAVGEPQAKDWQGLWFHEGSIGNLNSLSMRYAGKDFYKDGYIYTVAISEAIRAEGTSLAIQGSSFLHNGSLFIHALAATNLIVENSVFTDGGLALQVDGGTAYLDNNEYITFTQDPPTQVVILPN